MWRPHEVGPTGEEILLERIRWDSHPVPRAVYDVEAAREGTCWSWQEAWSQDLWAHVATLTALPVVRGRARLRVVGEMTSCGDGAEIRDARALAFLRLCSVLPVGTCIDSGAMVDGSASSAQALRCQRTMVRAILRLGEEEVVEHMTRTPMACAARPIEEALP